MVRKRGSLEELKELRAAVHYGTDEERKAAGERVREIAKTMFITEPREKKTRARAATRAKELKKACTSDGVTTCEGCGWAVPEQIGNRAMHLHHVVPVANGGNNVHTNLVVICPNCHVIAHALIERLHSKAPRDRDSLLAALRADPLSLLRPRS